MFPLIWSLLKPYRSSLAIILAAMLVQTAMSVATPWPLKIVLDNVVGVHKLPHWLDDFLRPFSEQRHQDADCRRRRDYNDSDRSSGRNCFVRGCYHTTSVGQWVANDLRCAPTITCSSFR